MDWVEGAKDSSLMLHGAKGSWLDVVQNANPMVLLKDSSVNSGIAKPNH
jgi:hypothetical protein